MQCKTSVPSELLESIEILQYFCTDLIFVGENARNNELWPDIDEFVLIAPHSNIAAALHLSRFIIIK